MSGMSTGNSFGTFVPAFGPFDQVFGKVELFTAYFITDDVLYRCKLLLFLSYPRNLDLVHASHSIWGEALFINYQEKKFNPGSFSVLVDTHYDNKHCTMKLLPTLLCKKQTKRKYFGSLFPL